MLDEATASIDRDTDRLIQSMIRDSFEGVTTMVIAHRLNTIMDFDRILVFDEGRVVEFDTVSENIWQLCTNTFCPLLACF
jgi:ATP-binding cassette subfamily C (CFTR/MRP) protein 1